MIECWWSIPPLPASFSMVTNWSVGWQCNLTLIVSPFTHFSICCFLLYVVFLSLVMCVCVCISFFLVQRPGLVLLHKCTHAGSGYIGLIISIFGHSISISHRENDRLSYQMLTNYSQLFFSSYVPNHVRTLYFVCTKKICPLNTQSTNLLAVTAIFGFVLVLVWRTNQKGWWNTPILNHQCHKVSPNTHTHTQRPNSFNFFLLFSMEKY